MNRSFMRIRSSSNRRFIFLTIEIMFSSFIFSFENSDDCLAYALIVLYESLLWCVQIAYELFLKSFWEILLYIKQEIQYIRSHNKTISYIDMISMNNSAMHNYPLISNRRNDSDLSRYHLRSTEARNRQRHRRLPKHNR